jgi:hypothetical protein
MTGQVVCKRPSGSVLVLHSSKQTDLPHSPQSCSSRRRPSQEHRLIRLRVQSGMHGAMRDSYVPDHDYAYQRRPDTPRSSSTLTNTPFRTATSSSSPYTTRRRSTQHTPPDNTATTIDTSLPKNFPKPLTCFFWQQNGRCSKRDIDCVYAHWDTGYMSSAPVTPLGCMYSPANLPVTSTPH